MTQQTTTITASPSAITEIVEVYTNFLICTFDSFSETGEEPEECKSILVDGCNIEIKALERHTANLLDVIESYEFDCKIVTK